MLPKDTICANGWFWRPDVVRSRVGRTITAKPKGPAMTRKSHRRRVLLSSGQWLRSGPMRRQRQGQRAYALHDFGGSARASTRPPCAERPPPDSQKDKVRSRVGGGQDRGMGRVAVSTLLSAGQQVPDHPTGWLFSHETVDMECEKMLRCLDKGMAKVGLLCFLVGAIAAFPAGTAKAGGFWWRLLRQQ